MHPGFCVVVFSFLLCFVNAYLDLLMDFITHGKVMILDLETLLWTGTAPQPLPVHALRDWWWHSMLTGSSSAWSC